MRCPRSEELFSDYLDDTLSIPLRLDLEAHIGSCPNCASLLASFREVIETLSQLEGPQPSLDLADRILATIKPALSNLQQPSTGLASLALPPRVNWAIWGAAAAFVVFLLVRPPAFLDHVRNHASRLGHQAYSFGLRIYRGSERVIDDLNVLRMTVGVAFEDRLDRLNERLKDLEEARRKSEPPPEDSGKLGPSSELTDLNTRTKLVDPRSLL